MQWETNHRKLTRQHAHVSGFREFSQNFSSYHQSRNFFVWQHLLPSSQVTLSICYWVLPALLCTHLPEAVTCTCTVPFARRSTCKQLRASGYMEDMHIGIILLHNSTGMHESMNYLASTGTPCRQRKKLQNLLDSRQGSGQGGARIFSADGCIWPSCVIRSPKDRPSKHRFSATRWRERIAFSLSNPKQDECAAMRCTECSVA